VRHTQYDRLSQQQLGLLFIERLLWTGQRLLKEWNMVATTCLPIVRILPLPSARSRYRAVYRTVGTKIPRYVRTSSTAASGSSPCRRDWCYRHFFLFLFLVFFSFLFFSAHFAAWVHLFNIAYFCCLYGLHFFKIPLIFAIQRFWSILHVRRFEINVSCWKHRNFDHVIT